MNRNKLFLLAGAIFLSLLVSFIIYSQEGEEDWVTQTQFVDIFLDVLGIQSPEGSSFMDKVNLLRARGITLTMIPALDSSDWNPNKFVTVNDLAVTLVQILDVPNVSPEGEFNMLIELGILDPGDSSQLLLLDVLYKAIFRAAESDLPGAGNIAEHQIPLSFVD